MKQIDFIAISKMFTPAFLKGLRPEILSSETAEEFLDRIHHESGESLKRAHDLASKTVQECQVKGIGVIDFTMPSYPERLSQIGTPPPLVYTRGDTSLLKRVVSIIGTRHSTTLGNRIAERLGDFFSSHLSICNGLVEGIDEHVFRREHGAIPNIVGVASGGLDFHNTCSATHAKNINDVLEAGGLVISEYDPWQKADQFSGSKASRIQAGLSQGLILVQSGINGGSRYTVEQFSKFDRPLGVVQYKAAAEYETDVFEANRRILEEGLNGLAVFIGKRTTKSICVKDIIPISGKEDYGRFLKAMEEKTEMLEDDSLFGND